MTPTETLAALALQIAENVVAKQRVEQENAALRAELTELRAEVEALADQRQSADREV